VNEFKQIEDENKKLKKELTTTKVKLRNTSKDRQILDSNLSKCSFASRILAFSDTKNKSLSRDRSQTELGFSNRIDSQIEKLKTKVGILQSANDKVVRENATLRLRRKNYSFRFL
jgi:regulator of replication initiation timing